MACEMRAKQAEHEVVIQAMSGYCDATGSVAAGVPTSLSNTPTAARTTRGGSPANTSGIISTSLTSGLEISDLRTPPLVERSVGDGRQRAAATLTGTDSNCSTSNAGGSSSSSIIGEGLSLTPLPGTQAADQGQASCTHTSDGGHYRWWFPLLSNCRFGCIDDSDPLTAIHGGKGGISGVVEVASIGGKTLVKTPTPYNK